MKPVRIGGRARDGRPGGRPVAVGTAVACCPPHRPVLALLTHTVPTLDSWRRSARLRCFAHTLKPAFPAFPARCPERVRLLRVLLSQQPSLRNLRRRLPAFVRLPRRYYAAVRLLAAVHGGLMAHRLLLPARLLPRAATGSPGSRAGSFSACLGSSTPRGRASLALARMRVVAFRTG